jgi:biopolymer transport protein ExbB
MTRQLFADAVALWLSGGWAMIALAVNAFILFAIGANLWIHFRGRGFHTVRESTWRRWIDRVDERRGSLGETIGFVMGAGSLHELGARFGELRAMQIAPYARDLRFMRRAVSTAPLLGLLGTVTGMLSTFDALAGGSGGQKTMDLIASGISEALITTETGLVIALPGLFFQYHLARERDRYEAFLSHLETVCAQAYYRLTRTGQAAARPAGSAP